MTKNGFRPLKRINNKSPENCLHLKSLIKDFCFVALFIPYNALLHLSCTDDDQRKALTTNEPAFGVDWLTISAYFKI